MRLQNSNGLSPHAFVSLAEYPKYAAMIYKCPVCGESHAWLRGILVPVDASTFPCEKIDFESPPAPWGKTYWFCSFACWMAYVDPHWLYGDIFGRDRRGSP